MRCSSDKPAPTFAVAVGLPGRPLPNPCEPVFSKIRDLVGVSAMICPVFSAQEASTCRLQLTQSRWDIRTHRVPRRYSTRSFLCRKTRATCSAAWSLPTPNVVSATSRLLCTQFFLTANHRTNSLPISTRITKVFNRTEYNRTKRNCSPLSTSPLKDLGFSGYGVDRRCYFVESSTSKEDDYLFGMIFYQLSW